MGARKRPYRAIEIYECGLTVSLGVVEDALDASFFRQSVEFLLSVVCGRTEVRFPFSECVFDSLRGAFKFCSEDCGLAGLASCYGSFKTGFVG